MEILGTTLENIEDIAQKEISELISKEAKIILPGILGFTANEQELINIIHNSRAFIKFYSLISTVEFRNFENLKEKISNLDFSKLQEPFVVRVEKKDNEEFKSLNLERDVGEIIHETFNKEVNLKDPTTIICLIIRENTCFITIDYTKEKLSRRDYRINLNVHTVNPLIYYFMLRFSDWKVNEILVDPFANTGEILIEAASYALRMPSNKDTIFQYTKLTNLVPNEEVTKIKLKIYGLDENQFNIKKTMFNATAAGVQEEIKLSQGGVEWIDTEFKEKEINKIISYPPYTSKTHSKKEIKEKYYELFHQADYVLGDEGNITILHPVDENIQDYINGTNFKLEKTRKLEINNKAYLISIFKKVYKQE